MAFRDLVDRMLGRSEQPAPLPELPPVKTSEQIVAELDAFEDSLDDRVPAAVLARVERVTGIVRDTIPRLDQLGGGSYQAHSVVATATSYLPEAVGAYLRLPRQWADSRPISGHKTALMVLCDQLDLLGYKMGEVRDAVLRADAAALVAHGAFLSEKFGSGGDLELGTTPAPSQPGDAPARLTPPEGS